MLLKILQLDAHRLNNTHCKYYGRYSVTRICEQNRNKYKMMALDLKARTSNSNIVEMCLSLRCQMAFSCDMQKAYAIPIK